MKFDALDEDRKNQAPANHYFIKKATKLDLIRKKNASLQNITTKVQNNQVEELQETLTIHMRPGQKKLDHRKLLSHYCGYILPELKDKISSDLLPLASIPK